MVALRDGNETRLYRGNGTSSILNLSGTNGFYSSERWVVPAMTASDFNNDGRDEIISAFHSASETRIYRGNGISSALNYGYFYSSTIWNIPALAVGSYRNGSTPQLVTAFVKKNKDETRIYHGDGVTSATNRRF